MAANQCGKASKIKTYSSPWFETPARGAANSVRSRFMETLVGRRRRKPCRVACRSSELTADGSSGIIGHGSSSGPASPKGHRIIAPFPILSLEAVSKTAVRRGARSTGFRWNGMELPTEGFRSDAERGESDVLASLRASHATNASHIRRRVRRRSVEQV